jgi:hypothetical protein
VVGGGAQFFLLLDQAQLVVHLVVVSLLLGRVRLISRSLPSVSNGTKGQAITDDDQRVKRKAHSLAALNTFAHLFGGSQASAHPKKSKTLSWISLSVPRLCLELRAQTVVVEAMTKGRVSEGWWD